MVTIHMGQIIHILMALATPIAKIPIPQAA